MSIKSKITEEKRDCKTRYAKLKDISNNQIRYTAY